MAKPIISNSILAIVAVGVLFFIGKSVYDVFTRAPVNGVENSQPPHNNNQSGPTVSGTIQLPAEDNLEQTANPSALPAETSNEPSSQNQPPAQEPAITVNNSASQTPNTEKNPVTETVSAPEEADGPHALKSNPDLKQAIPPVPLAPPSPFPTPAAPASDEQLFEATGNLNNHQTPENTIINDSFPAPQADFPAPDTPPEFINESAPFEVGEGSPFSNFPAPINNGNTNPGYVNPSNPELERLQNLRQQKERLRNDLGF